MTGDLFGHVWAEVQQPPTADVVEYRVAYVCQACGHVEPGSIVICYHTDVPFFTERFGADQVRESAFVMPGEAYAIDGRTACTTMCPSARWGGFR